MLGRLEVAPSCHMCAPTKVNGTRAQEWHRCERDGEPTIADEGEAPRRGAEEQVEEPRRGWAWKPREILLYKHRRLRYPLFRTHGGKSAQAEFKRGKSSVTAEPTMLQNGSHLNTSSQDTVLSRPPWVTTTLGCFLIFTIVVDILGNLLVIFSVYRNKKLRNAGERVASVEMNAGARGAETARAGNKNRKNGGKK